MADRTCQAPEHPEDRLPAGTGGVEVLAQRPQLPAAPPHLPDSGDQLALRPADPAATITIDELPGAFVPQALSAGSSASTG